MTGKRGRPKTFLDLLASPWTLLPALAGLSALIVGWASDRADLLRGCSFGAAGAGALALAVLLTRWLLNGPVPVDPAVTALRQQVVDNAAAALAAGPRGGAQVARASGTPAAVEQG